MFLQILLAIILGCIAGTFTGIIPGIHVNLLSLIILSFSTYLLGITTPLIIAVFIISIALTHTFVNAIPSIYLGAPDSDTALSVLPGHKLLLKGLGHEAVKLPDCNNNFISSNDKNSTSNIQFSKAIHRIHLIVFLIDNDTGRKHK